MNMMEIPEPGADIVCVKTTIHRKTFSKMVDMKTWTKHGMNGKRDYNSHTGTYVLMEKQWCTFGLTYP